MGFHDNLALVDVDDQHQPLSDVATSGGEVTALNKAMLLRLAEAYMDRFEEELEQIGIKNSVGKNRDNHRSRAENIRFVKEGEKRDFEGPGLEFPDLLDPDNFKYFRSWNGELRFVQNIKIKKFTRKALTENQGTESQIDETPAENGAKNGAVEDDMEPIT